jgi:PHD/YefM family antitoxin component YafN of YafNO toxin-antitoxin module
LPTEITLSAFQQAVDHWLDQAQQQPVTLTRDGQPFAVIVSHTDWMRTIDTQTGDQALMLGGVPGHGVAG